MIKAAVKRKETALKVLAASYEDAKDVWKPTKLLKGVYIRTKRK